jgi:hypothetical protein
VGRKDYVATAERHADALAPRLARLTIKVEQPIDGLQVKRDGSPVDRAQWGVAIPVDMGSHTVEAAAPGHKAWATAVAVGQDGAQAVLAVPALDADPEATTAPPAAPVLAAPTPAPGPSQPAPPPPTPDRSSGSVQRIVGGILAIGGISSLAVGGGVAIAAKNKNDQSVKDCLPTNPNLCPPTGLQERNDARSLGNDATVLMSGGAAALVAGVVLWFTAPSAPQPPAASARVVFLPVPGGASIEGTW